MWQARQSGAGERPAGACRASPQHEHTGPSWTGNSVQQASQIGMEESRGRGEPQSEQEAGRSAQLKLSMGVRRKRTTARHFVVCNGGTSVMRMPESLWKTHLATGCSKGQTRSAKYTAFRFRPSSTGVS